MKGVANIYLNLTQLYLEMARSIFTEIHYPPEKTIQETVAKEGISPSAGLIFAVTSVTIIYSYLALEAFVNYHLYKIWEASRRNYQALKKNNLLKRATPKYFDFYKAYGSRAEKFKDLKKTADLRDLGKRIKVLCEALNIPKIHEADAGLWEDFKGLLEEARHFLVHPFPDPTEFQETIKTILQKEEPGRYVQVTQNIVKHFYSQTGREIPGWVDENELLRLKGFEYLPHKV